MPDLTFGGQVTGVVILNGAVCRAICTPRYAHSSVSCSLTQIVQGHSSGKLSFIRALNQSTVLAGGQGPMKCYCLALPNGANHLSEALFDNRLPRHQTKTQPIAEHGKTAAGQ
jgi:hypothetical protein